MDLVSRIQRLPIGRFHYTLLVVIGLGWMFDAMDTGLISFILAKMAEDWQMTADQKKLGGVDRFCRHGDRGDLFRWPGRPFWP